MGNLRGGLVMYFFSKNNFTHHINTYRIWILKMSRSTNAHNPIALNYGLDIKLYRAISTSNILQAEFLCMETNRKIYNTYKVDSIFPLSDCKGVLTEGAVLLETVVNGRAGIHISKLSTWRRNNVRIITGLITFHSEIFEKEKCWLITVFWSVETIRLIVDQHQWSMIYLLGEPYTICCACAFNHACRDFCISSQLEFPPKHDKHQLEAKHHSSVTRKAGQ